MINPPTDHQLLPVQRVPRVADAARFGFVGSVYGGCSIGADRIKGSSSECRFHQPRPLLPELVLPRRWTPLQLPVQVPPLTLPTAQRPGRSLKTPPGRSRTRRARRLPSHDDDLDDDARPARGGARCGWRPWAELMTRVFQVDLEKCPLCGAPMKLRAVVTEPVNVRRYLRHLDEATELPPRAPARDPPYFHSHVVRRKLSEQLVLVA